MTRRPPLPDDGRTYATVDLEAWIGPCARPELHESALRDGPILTGVKLVARAWFRGVLAVQRGVARATGELQYELGGACIRSGCCCEEPVIVAERLVRRSALARRLFLRWQRTVNGFELVGDERDRNLRFRCTHFEPGLRSCDSYHSRPGMCRDYPRPLLHASSPTFLAGCGHRAVARNASELSRALAESSLPPEKIEELERKLKVK